MLFTALLLLVSGLMAAGQTFQNPIRNPGADPHMVTAGGYYYLTNTQVTLISVTRATTIAGLANGDTRTVWTDTDPSRDQNMWAPEMHEIDGVWYIFYSAGDGDIGNGQRSFVIRGDGPDPYTSNYSFQAELTPATGSQGGSDGSDAWSIDGTYLVIGNESYHVVSAINPQGTQSIQITALDTQAWTVSGWNIISSPTEAWEMAGGYPNDPNPVAVNEGPNALYNAGNVWLSFSASWCGTPDYALGLLAYDGTGDPLNATSWSKSGPALQSANGNYGTGHNVFFSSPDGSQIWNAFHATTNPNGSCGGDRYTMAQEVTFDSSGSPDLGIPVAGGTPVTVPSGDGS